MRNPYFCGTPTPTPGLENLGLRTPTPTDGVSDSQVRIEVPSHYTAPTIRAAIKWHDDRTLEVARPAKTVLPQKGDSN